VQAIARWGRLSLSHCVMRTGKARWMRLFSRSGWVLTSSNVFSPKFHPVQEILHSESNKRFEAGSIYVGNYLVVTDG
jgi:hypothetical protein